MRRRILIFIVLASLSGIARAEDDLFVCPYPVTYCEDFQYYCDPAPCDWSFSRSGTWDWSDDLLSVTPKAGKKAIALTNGHVAAGICTLEATLRTSDAPYNRVWLEGWYVDFGNRVDLLMREETDTWVLKHRANGVIVAKGKGKKPILAGLLYHAKVEYDGARFSVYVDDMLTPLFAVPSAMPASGRVGFQVKNTAASFGYIMVD